MDTVVNQESRNDIIRFGKYVFLPGKRKLYFNRQVAGLTELESGLLALFCRFANRLLPRSYTLVNLWRNDTYFNSRSMDVYVSRLRKRLKDDPDISIKNVRGKGFKLLVPQIEIVSEDAEIM